MAVPAYEPLLTLSYELFALYKHAFNYITIKILNTSIVIIVNVHIVMHGSALHVGIAWKKMVALNNVLVVIFR